MAKGKFYNTDTATSHPVPNAEYALAGYEIRIKDHLETYWYTWFEGWSIINLENGEVLLSCKHVDQSGLHGALNKIRDLNLTLLSVNRFSPEK
jgi:hypothetical protein